MWGGFKRKIVTSMMGILMLGIGILTQGMLPGDMFTIAMVSAGLVGFSLPIANGSIGAIMQGSVAPDMQGRVFTLLGSLSGGMAPIGLAIAGPVSDVIGIQTWFRIAGMVCIGMALVGYLVPAVVNIESNNPNKMAEMKSEDQPLIAGGMAEVAPFTEAE
jgi:DHA3 family macrolide efflux protein-like MFS transporter